MRNLTKYFGSYSIAKYEKASGKTLISTIDSFIEGEQVAPMEPVITLIKLGNKDFSDEDAYSALDDYLKADEGHSLITAFFDLLKELDMDTKLLKGLGFNVEEFKEAFTKSITPSKTKTKVKSKVVSEEFTAKLP